MEGPQLYVIEPTGIALVCHNSQCSHCCNEHNQDIAHCKIVHRLKPIIESFLITNNSCKPAHHNNRKWCLMGASCLFTLRMLVQRFFGAAVGKGRQGAKTDIERLDLKELTCKQGIKEIAKM